MQQLFYYIDEKKNERKNIMFYKNFQKYELFEQSNEISYLSISIKPDSQLLFIKKIPIF